MKMKNAQVLNDNRDFLRLYKRGRFQAASCLVTYARRGGVRDRRRVGITATKKVGGAVQRNRAKRVIRAAWREVESAVPGGWDFIFVARARTASVPMRQVREAMAAQIRSLTAPDKARSQNPSQAPGKPRDPNQDKTPGKLRDKAPDKTRHQLSEGPAEPPEGRP